MSSSPAAHAAKFDDVPGDYTRIAVGEPVDGWLSYADVRRRRHVVRPRRPRRAPRDPLLLYFTSGTTAKPKLVEHTHASYPVGHLSTMYWIGLQPGDVHLNVSSPGWAKHAWSNVYAPWIAEACVMLFNFARFDAPALLDQMVRCEVTTFCAPPTVWRMLIQEDLGRWQVPLREALAAGEPLNPEVIEQVRRQWGITVRDGYGQTETTAQIGNTPGQPVKPGSMGRPLPGYVVALLDPITGEPADEGEIALDLSERPLGLMTGYRDSAERSAAATAGGYYHTGDVAAARRRRLHHLRRAHRRRVQGLGLPDLAVRARERADRARGGRRGGGRAVARPAAPRGAEGLRQRSPPATSRRARPRWRSCASRASSSRRTSASAGSSSPSCRRRSRARSAGSSCARRGGAPARRRAAARPRAGRVLGGGLPGVAPLTSLRG